ALEAQGQFPPAPIEQRDLEGQVHRLLFRLARCGRRPLLHLQMEGAFQAVELSLDRKLRGSRLTVPEPELSEVHAGRVFHRLHEVVAGDGLPIVALEIQIHSSPESLPTEEGMYHPDDLG